MSRRRIGPCSRETILKLGFFIRGTLEPGVVYSPRSFGPVRLCLEKRGDKVVSWRRGQTDYRDIGLVAEPSYGRKND